MIRIRPAASRDYEVIAALRNLGSVEEIGPEELERRDHELGSSSYVLRIVAESDGTVVGTGSLSRNLWFRAGRSRISVRVGRGFQRLGVGTAILQQLEGMAVVRDVDSLEAVASDQDGAGRAFFEKWGYQFESHSFGSTLNLATFEPAALDLAALFPGYVFFSFAETAEDEEARRRLWELNTTTSRDEPHNDPDHLPTFEDFEESIIGASWFNPRGQFIAAQEGLWVGMSAVGEVFEGSLYNLFTGVRREFRGRGLARALKVLATTYAKNAGKPYIRTNNDSRNEPMLAINRSLGYEPQPGWHQLTKNLEISRHNGGSGVKPVR